MDSSTDVLIVDDEPLVGEVIEELLQAEGFTARALSDTSLLRGFLKTTQPILLFMDLQLRIGTGLQVIETLSSERIPLPIIILITGALEFDSSRALKNGVSLVLEKPISLKMLAKVTALASENRAYQSKRKWLRLPVKQKGVLGNFPIQIHNISCGGCSVVNSDEIYMAGAKNFTILNAERPIFRAKVECLWSTRQYSGYRFLETEEIEGESILDIVSRFVRQESALGDA